MSSVTIRKPRPLFRPELKLAPGHPFGNRVLIREFPVESMTEGGIHKADIAKEHYFGGWIISAGDQAADALYDLGAEVGDEVWFAKYAGVIQAWQHIVAEGTVPDCAHDSAWDFVPADDPAWAVVGGKNENMELRSCRTCGAKKVSERIIILSVEDLHLNPDVQARLERGELIRERAQTEDGRTRYFMKHKQDHVDSFEIGKETR